MSEYRSGWISLLWKMNGCHMLRYINFIANLSCGWQYQNKLCQTMKICTVALYISRHIIPNMSTAIRISNCKMRLIRTFVDDNAFAIVSLVTYKGLMTFTWKTMIYWNVFISQTSHSRGVLMIVSQAFMVSKWSNLQIQQYLNFKCKNR